MALASDAYGVHVIEYERSSERNDIASSHHRVGETIFLTRAAQMTERFKPQYDTRGYVIVPSLIRADEFDNLRTAATRTIDKTRTGEWPHRRTVGRQFPPYDNDHPDSWGVQHLMHPDLREPAFAEWYTSDDLVKVVTELLECEEGELQMGECLFYGPVFVAV